MRTISLPEGIHLLERGWLSSNCFLLEDARANVLIDTGYWTHSDQTTQKSSTRICTATTAVAMLRCSRLTPCAKHLCHPDTPAMCLTGTRPR